MSDFDKIINDRLNEDDGEFFPQKKANWDKLTQRLADFDKANPLPKNRPSPTMRPVWKRLAWSSAAAFLIGVSGLLFWYFNEINKVKQQNAQLKEEVAALKLDKKAADPEAILKKQNTANVDANNKTSETVATQSNGADNGFKTPETQRSVEKNTPSVFEEKPERFDKNKQNAAIIDNKTPNSNNVLGKKESPKDATVQRKSDSQIAKMDNKKVLDPVPFDKNNEPLKSQKAQLTDNIALKTDTNQSTISLETNKADGSENKSEIAITPKTEHNNLKTDRKNIENIETVPQIPPSVTNTITDKNIDLEQAKMDALALEKAKQDSLTQALVASQEAKSDAESVTPPIIKTDKGLKRWRQFLPKGFAIGAHVVYGSIMPQIAGIKPTTGQGLSAELKFAKNISVAVTGDFLETHFELQERPRRFHLPETPDPQQPNVGLHHIKGEQKSQMLSVNAKYVIGTDKWWIQPFVTVGHSWRKIDEHPVNFVYKNFTTGIETPSQTKVNTERVKNLWQAGIGLEKKIKRWTFGISAEMQKNFSNPTDRNGNNIAANVGILRGGVKFNIF